MAEPTKQRVPSVLDVARDGIDQFDDLAGFIANPPTNRPLAGALGRAGQSMCNFYGSSPGAARLAFGGNSATVGLLCQPYFDSNGYDGPVPATPPFTGGQCEGVLYGASYSYFDSPTDTIPQNFSPASGQFSGGDLYGPVTSAGFVVNDPSFCGGGQVSYTVVGRNAAGATKKVALNLAGSPCRLAGVRITNLNFVRLGGGAECGNIPTGPAPGPNPPPSPGPFPPGQEPGVDPDGRPYFFVPPIEPEYPGDEPIEVPVFGPSGQPSGGPPSGGGEPGTPETAAPGDDAEGEAPEGEMLWGLRITISSTPALAKLYAPGVYRAVCYVYMGDEDGLDHDPAGAMLRSGQLVLAERDYLTRWRVTANQGYTLSVTPYYKPIEEE